MTPEDAESKLKRGNWSQFMECWPSLRVEINEPFYIGETEVTQEQWEAVMGSTPWDDPAQPDEHDPRYPATSIDWEMANSFCRRLSVREGRRYSLPSEEEWEYACRAGSTALFCFGDSEGRLGQYAWFSYNPRKRMTKPGIVASKKPNDFGLYDMHGNAWEWCSSLFLRYGVTQSDRNGTPVRVLRGGSYSSDPYSCISAMRNGTEEIWRSKSYGLRVKAWVAASPVYVGPTTETTARERLSVGVRPAQLN